MNIYKKIGSKDRLFEMFENVNKIKLNEYDEDYYNKPSQPKGIGEFNNVEWKLLHDLLKRNEVKKGSLSEIVTLNDLIDYDGMLTPEEFEQLRHFGLIEIINNQIPIIGQNEYISFDAFINKAKEIWNKDGDFDAPDPETKIFNAMQGGIGESNNSIKENNSIEIGTDSGIFHQLYSYFSRTLLTRNEFTIGELTINIEVEPTKWVDVPHRPATRMQPEEGGYPEDVEGRMTDIVIWDREDNEYRLDQEAFEKLNSTIRGFDGDLYDELAQKAANGGEDEYSRADFDRKSGLENESVIKEDNSDINQEIHDELDMRYSPSERRVRFEDINDVAEMYGGNYEMVAQIAADVMATNQKRFDDEFDDNLKEFIGRMRENNVDYNQYSETSIWEAFEDEYHEGSKFEEFKRKWDKLTKDPDQMNMFEANDNPNLDSIRYRYENGYYIPIGYEDKKVVLKPVEGSGDYLEVEMGMLHNDDNRYEKIKLYTTWDEARKGFLDSIT